MPDEPLLSIPDATGGLGGDAGDLAALFHRLNNQLGIILANAELLESKLNDPNTRARASQIVATAVDAIGTTQNVRSVTWAGRPPDDSPAT